MKPHRVLFHVNEGSTNKWLTTLRNIDNLFGDIGDGLEIEVVAHSEGIGLLYKMPNKLSEKINQLAAKGVRFAVCANSMRQQNLTKEFFLDIAIVVPSGVGELVRKQSEGWAYIKP